MSKEGKLSQAGMSRRAFLGFGATAALAAGAAAVDAVSEQRRVVGWRQQRLRQ